MTTSATVPPARKRAPAAPAAPAPSTNHDAALLRLLLWLPLVAALLLVRFQDPLRAWVSRPHGTLLSYGARVVAYAVQPVAIRWLLLAVAVACGVLVVESLWTLCTLLASRLLLPPPTQRVYLRVRIPPPTNPTTVDTGRPLLQRLHAVLPPYDAGPWLSLILSALPDAPVELGVSIVGGTPAQRTTWIAAIRTAVKGIDAEAYVDQVPDPLETALAHGGRPRRHQLQMREYRVRSAHGMAPQEATPARDRIDTMGTLVAALPPQRALDASAAAALENEGFRLARPAAVPNSVRYRECHLTLRPRSACGTLADTFRATIRTVVVSEANGPRRSARRALAELTTALHTYTLLAPGQPHPTPLVPISHQGSVLRVIAGVTLLMVIGWTLLLPVVGMSLPLLPERFTRVSQLLERTQLQLVDQIPPWLIGQRHPSPAAFLLLGLLALTMVVLLRRRARRAPPARRLVLRAPRTPVPRVLTPWAWWRPPLNLHAAQLGQLYHLPTARLGNGVRWLLHRIIHPAPLAYIPLDELWSGRWLPLGYGVRPDGSEGLVGMLMRSAREALAVAAPPGTGKTRFALRIFTFVRRVGLGIFGIDGKGDDSKGFVGKARRMVQLEDEANLVLLDPTDAWTISLNPLLGIDLADELGVDEALGQIERIFASVDPYTWTKSTRMPGVLRKVMQLVLASELIPTIAHGKQVLDDPAYRARLLPLCREHNSEVASFWDAIERGDDTIPEATLSGLRSRFDALLDTRSMRRLFSLPVRSFSFEEAIANRYIVLNPIPEQRLGGRAGPVGMLTFQLFLRAAFHRPGSDETRENFVVALDEFDFLVRNGDPQDIATALTKVRSFGIVLILLHQFLIQLGAFKDFVLSIPNRIIMRVDNPDAQEYAKLYPHSGLTASDIANQDNHHYVKHMHGPTPIGPHSVRPLEWLPEEEAHVPDHAGDWQAVLPTDSPTPTFDREVAALIYATPREQRAATVERLAAADEARWQRVWERWQAIASAQRAFILAHPGCIPLPTAAELALLPELVDAVHAAQDDPAALQTIQRDQQRMTRQLWLSRLWFGVPPLLADVMYARIRTAIAPADTATDRPATQRRRSHERQDRADRGGADSATAFGDDDETPTAWAGSDRDRMTTNQGIAAMVFDDDDDDRKEDAQCQVAAARFGAGSVPDQYRIGAVAHRAPGGLARHPNGLHRLCHINAPGHMCRDWLFAMLYSAAAPQRPCSCTVGAGQERCTFTLTATPITANTLMRRCASGQHPRRGWAPRTIGHDAREEDLMVSGAAVSGAAGRTTTPSAGIDPFNIPNLLAGLAWLREASIDHIRRLWFPDYSVTGMRKLLRRLEADDLIERRMWAIPRPRIGTPVRQPTMWSLTKEGRSWLKDHDLFPPAYKLPRHRRVLSHDTMTADTIVRMIELGRPAALSGIYVEQELRLNPPQRRPIMDSLVILRTGGAYPFPNAVPWTSDPKMPGEKRRRYAIESDGGKETESVIAGKAQAYRAAATAAWVVRYGRFPIVVWVVRTEARLRDINRIWAEVWPDGKWLLTVDSWLPYDRWIEYHNGQTRVRTLFGS